MFFGFINVYMCFPLFQSFTSLVEKPLIVDLTVEEGQRLKVVYGSQRGFHAIDLDTSVVTQVYIPSHVSGPLCVCVCVCVRVWL